MLKTDTSEMDLTSENPKNEMHLAWFKLVFTHFYIPSAIPRIYTTNTPQEQKVTSVFSSDGEERSK